ncbi:hypothetical protein DBV15_12867, partial [Temnothorax longispinosus]
CFLDGSRVASGWVGGVAGGQKWVAQAGWEQWCVGGGVREPNTTLLAHSILHSFISLEDTAGMYIRKRRANISKSKNTDIRSSLQPISKQSTKPTVSRTSLGSVWVGILGEFPTESTRVVVPAASVAPATFIYIPPGVTMCNVP